MSQDDAGYGSLEFTVRRAMLAQLADWAMAAVPALPPGNGTRPVNGCFQVTVSPEFLRVAATDQAKAVAAEIPAVLTQSSGQVYLPAKKLKSILGEAREGDVTVSVKGSTAVVTAGPSTWQLRLPPADGYIGIPDLSAAVFAPVSREALHWALDTVRHAVGRDAGRPAFTQVRVSGDATGRMFACATDSAQFSSAPADGFPCDMLIPGAALDDLLKLLAKSPADNAEVAEAGPYAVFRVGPVTLAARRLDAPFPDVDKMFLGLVKGNDMRLGVGKDELTAALRRVRVNTDATTSAVALIADSDGGKRGRLTVTGRDKAGNSAEEVVPARWEGGQHLMVVNAVFLANLLAAHPGADCEFLVGKDRGKARAPLLLRDEEKQVTGTCPQMPPVLVGY
jgi:DNA polymerase III sliding clamp (beta) subunit (PCNA family)